MRVSQISVYHQPKIYASCKPKPVLNQTPKPQPEADINFKGKFGSIVGGIFGTAVIVTAALTTAPVAICFTAAGALAGAIGGDVAEDSINKKDKN